MSEQYSRELLRVAVAQICQTIGYNATQTSSLELLQDLLHRFLNEFSRDLRRQVEHDNRTSPCLEDVSRTFTNLNLSLHELLDYIGNVEPVPFVTDVPKFPVNKPSNLNFLKPGSKEVLSRPVHIFEHLPPMLPPDTPQPYSNESNSGVLQNKSLGSFGAVADTNEGSLLSIPEENKIISSSSSSLTKIKNDPDNDRTKLDINVPPNSSILPSAITGKSLQMIDEHGRRTREIVSVVMTTGGFISPAIEGKLPESGIPSIVEKFLGLDAPPPPTPPPPPEPVSTIDATTKSEKNALELTSKHNTMNEMPSILAKKNAPSVESREKNNKVDESGNAELSVSPKKSSKQNMKKTAFIQSNAAQQPIALKLLKKAKKKNTALSPNSTEAMPSNLEEVLDPNSDKLSEKARRKRLKMLQKMLKNSQKHQGVSDSKKETKKMKSLPNVNLFPDIPAGMERGRIEKMLKKQAKQKQKQLKKQLTLETQRNNFSESIPAQMHFDGATPLCPLKPQLQQMEGVAQKIDAKHEVKPTNLIMSNMAPQVLPSYDKTGFLPSAEQAQVECLPIPLTQSNPKSSEKISGLEIKLSNEPDRNKLNIFKKISKAQKGAQVTPPLKQTMPSNSFTGSEGQIINLPSGTTITPAPLAIGEPGNLIPTKINHQEGIQEGSVSSTTTTLQTEIVNKPKKRGRKPGSKNQPKVLPINGPLAQEQNLNPGLVKKQKKAKIPNAVKLSQMPDSMPHNRTGSTLNFPKFDNAAMLGQVPFSNVPPQIFPAPIPLKTQRKERKEKEKSKPLEIYPNVSDMDALKDIKPEHTSPVNLSGMQLNPLNMLFNSNIEQNVSPQQKSRKRLSNQTKNSNPSATMLPSFLSGAQASPGFPQLPSNMLSMLPFPFPPRPGLIPAPALFPAAAGLTNFSSQLPNSASAVSGVPAGILGLGPPFFPFPTMKPQNVPVMNQTQDRNPKERLKEAPVGPTSFPIDRSYCNVAPLVPPESIKQVTETTGNTSNPLLTAAKHHKKIVPIPGKVPLIDTQMNINEDKYNDIFIPNMGTGYPPNLKYEAAANNLLRKASMAAAQSIINPALALNEVKPSEKNAPTGGVDDPIEVSDDSDETTTQPDGSTRNPFNSTALPLLKTPQLPNQALSAPSPLPNAVIQSDLPVNFADSQEPDVKIIPKDAKKLKKVQKHLKKNTKIGEPESGGSLDVFTVNCTSGGGPGSDRFSKLAGGADLIPLAGTGSAYSARSIPSTSLTGSRPLNLNISAFDQTVKELTAEPEKRFSDVSIIPNVQKKKSKEHKKLRKLKDGDGVKVKKKKDKKDKMKDKELLDLALGQEGSFEKRGDKETLKKLKKERKKQKQRLSANPNEPPQAHFQSLPSNTQIPISMFGNLPESSSSLAQSTPPTVSTTSFPSASSDSTAPSLVPKLTLKIGSSQSPTPVTAKVDDEVVKIATPKREPSPELARFSPLVTRPPKQKLSQTDNPMTLLTIPNSENKPTLTVKPADNITAPQPIIPPPSPWLSGGTLTASSVLLPQQLMTSSAAKPKTDQHLHQNPTSKTDISSSGNSNAPRGASAVLSNNQNPVPLIAETNRPSSYVDAEGNTVWICPACGKVDDGSPMIGCDGCDAWYHWECVGIAVAPNDNEDWFCRVCITRKKGFHSGGEGTEKKRKRNKKK